MAFDKKFEQDYQQGLDDMLNGEVRLEWAHLFTPGYAAAVNDMSSTGVLA